ncbi:unnamed protein product [Angiostrongylus costaricensis]|uniref:CBS domain-containing protein n=1 Tax=Angiostrongylus costaricensis TaxID=334426 RepID=A0A0R3P9H8_ANGCS|nr:unnamed protein product [Angiostrongylus costaricensis]
MLILRIEDCRIAFVGKYLRNILWNIQRVTSDRHCDDERAFDYMYKTFSNVIIDDPDLVYAEFLRHSQCYETMSSNNKVVVFTDDLSVRKAFYGLLYNSTRTGLIADSTTMQVTGVLSITDFTMVLMMLWKFRENSEAMKGTSLSYSELEAVDIFDVKISRWKGNDELYRFSLIYQFQSVYRAVELLTKHRIHRLPVLDRRTGNCTFILTHRRILHYLWKHATHDMTLMQVLDMIIDNGISGVPIVEASTMKVVDVYTRFDAVAAAFSTTIDMSVSMSEAIRQRQKVYGDRDGVITAPEDVRMLDLVETFVEKNVHRIFLVDNCLRLKVRL